VAGKRLLRTLARQRGRAHIVGIVADQAPTSSGGRVWLNFLGRDTAFFPGPAEIARVCKYATFFVGVRRLARGRYCTRVAPIAEAGEAIGTLAFTARYAAQMEIEIRAAPANWAWTHRRWKLVHAAAEAQSAPNPPLG
jgi:Kdo2-lipid IVA lauroyltransferase/acyltransferase